MKFCIAPYILIGADAITTSSYGDVNQSFSQSDAPLPTRVSPSFRIWMVQTNQVVNYTLEFSPLISSHPRTGKYVVNSNRAQT